MARVSKYKWEKDDVVGLYRVIKVLPSEPNVKNLVIYSECLLCGEKVKRFSNRMDSKHRGCTANAVVDKEPEVIKVKPHIRKDGAIVETNDRGFVVGEVKPEDLAVTENDAEDLELGDLNLPQEVIDALNFDVDKHAIEMIRKSEALDTSTKFLFITTLRRYLTLVHIARKIERKLARTGELTVLGSSGNQVANPLIVQYKSVSSESNVTVRVLGGIISKFEASDKGDDPLIKALNGGK